MDNTTTVKTGNDWCHLCGIRQQTKFVTFDIPKNAEHSTDNGERGYFRICKGCVTEFSMLLTETN